METRSIRFYSSESCALTFLAIERKLFVWGEINNSKKHAISLVLPLLHLLYSEDNTLESAVVKVISPGEQSESGLEFRESSSSLVVKEILQEAPELITEQLAHLLRGERWLFLLNTGRFNGVSLWLAHAERVWSILGLTIPLKTTGSVIREAGCKEFVKE